MKKLILLITALFLLASVQGQILRYGFAVSSTPEDPLGFTDEYDTVYAAFATKPHADTADIFNDFVFSLDSAGFWARTHLLQVYCGASTAADAVINWITPGTYNATAMNTPTFTRYQGFDFNGTDQYLNTGFNPLGIVAQDDVTIGAYVREDVAEAAYVMSAYVTAYLSINPKDASDRFGYRINTNLDEVQSHENGAGFYVATRRGATDSQAYYNGSSVDTSTDASTEVPDAEMRVSRHGANYGTREVSMIIVLDAVSTAEVGALRTIVQRLHNRLGI